MLAPIDELNQLAHDEFEEALAPLFEGAPSLCAQLANGRPYSSYGQLLEHAARIVAELPADAQVELIDSHPRIGADPTSISALSRQEQGYGAADGPATDEQRTQAELDRLNAAYERRFGFRFVVHVGGRPRAEIVPLIEAALGRRREEEVERALNDIVAIARDRMAALMARQEERV